MDLARRELTGETRADKVADVVRWLRRNIRRGR
jgi:hypothetical protein